MVIGTEFHLDEANKFIEKRVKQLEQKNNSHLQKVLIYGVIITIILLFITYFLSKYFEKVLKNYRDTVSKKNQMITSVFQVIPDLLFIMKKDGTVVDYRAQKDSKLYIKPEKILNNKMQDVLPKDVASIFDENIKNLFKDNKLKIFKYKMNIQGKLKYFEARMAKLPLETHIMTIIRDITENISHIEELKFQSLLLEQSLAATDVIDENANFAYVNDAYVKMWGYNTKKEIIGTSPSSHCFDKNMPQTIIEKVEKNKEHIFQFKAQKKDGSTFDALMAVKYVYFNNKKIYIGSTMDITEKEKLSKQYEAIFKNAKEGIFLREINGTIIDVNPYIEKLYNRSKEELIGKNFMNLFLEKDKQIFKKINKQLIDKGFVKFEIELKKLDGTIFNASIQSSLLELEGKKIVQGILKDLTIENENKLILDRSKNIFENIQEGVMITSPNGYIIEVNKAFENITEYYSSEVIGKNPSILKSGKQEDIFYQKMWQSLIKKGIWSGNIYNKKKSGVLYTSYLTISGIKNDKNEIQHYVGIFTDISDALEYEKDLHEKDLLLIQQSKMAMMGEMIDNIAHQWKQPLSIISVSNGLIKFNQENSSFSTKEELYDVINNIDTQVKHLSSTIDDFRNFFQPDKIKKEFPLESCINRLFILIKSKLDNNDIEVITNIYNSNIFSIENEFVQVLMNIITNSLDELQESKEDKKYIFIDSYEEDNNIVISIKDNAGGIPENIIDKIFESRFTTKEEGKGTGIGLYMSRNIMKV